jgi:hypothetical protein
MCTRCEAGRETQRNACVGVCLTDKVVKGGHIFKEVGREGTHWFGDADALNMQGMVNMRDMADSLIVCRERGIGV